MGKPKLYCDFNNLIEDGLYALNIRTLETDLHPLGISLESLKNGSEAIFYMEDEDEEGRECLLLVDGVIQYDKRWKWIARVKEGTFRHERVQQED